MFLPECGIKEYPSSFKLGMDHTPSHINQPFWFRTLFFDFFFSAQLPGRFAFPVRTCPLYVRTDSGCRRPTVHTMHGKVKKARGSEQGPEQREKFYGAFLVKTELGGQNRSRSEHERGLL